MMRNKTFLALLFVMSAVQLIVSCKKTRPEEPSKNVNCETSYKVLFGEAVSTDETITAGYENGQIKILTSNNYNYAYEYAQDKVNITYSGKVLFKIDISNTLATRITESNSPIEQRLRYDKDRNLVKIESYENGNLTETKLLTYGNGNLLTLTQVLSSNPAVKKITIFDYFPEAAEKVVSETIHLLAGKTEPIIPLSLLGTISKNRLKKTQYTYQSGNFRSDISTEYSYMTGSDNIINKIIENSHTVTVSNGIQTENNSLKRTILVNATCN